MFKHRRAEGQAIVEFALIIVVLLMLMTVIIESGRILWGWVTVQNAARDGARYAITGRYELAFLGFPDPRLESIRDATRTGLTGLPLNNDPNALFEDDNYYRIEVWGVNINNQMQADYPGLPGKPVVVRVIYRVPIITPFLRPIVQSVPVFGQVVMNNELFGQQGNANQGVGVPPQLPPVPTPGVSPSPTPSPTPSNTPTVGPSSTPTHTASPTYTPSPIRCGTRFEGSLVAGTNFASITGEIGSNVELVDLTTGQTIGTDNIEGPFNGHACPGFSIASPLSPVLVQGHVILVSNLTDGTFDTAIVLPGTPTSTPSPTRTITPTPPPTNTPTITPSPTPGSPYIILDPTCGAGPGVQFSVRGFNWPTNKAVSLFFDNQLQTIVPSGHSGSFQYTWTFSNIAVGNHTVLATASGGITSSRTFVVPCPNITPTSPPATATRTPSPADLIIVGQPVLLATPPIVGWRPLNFRVPISNTGSVSVTNQFFVDIYFNPTGVISSGIPITNSTGYVAVGSLAGGTGRVLTITAPLGYTGSGNQFNVYGMVDSLKQASESNEFNNIAGPVSINVTPGPSPTPSPTPGPGSNIISGKAYARISVWLPQYRALVSLYQGSTRIAMVQSDITGYYEFLNVPNGVYSILSCITIDTTSYFGQRVGVTVPPSNTFAHVWMTAGVCPP